MAAARLVAPERDLAARRDDARRLRAASARRDDERDRGVGERRRRFLDAFGFFLVAM